MKNIRKLVLLLFVILSISCGDDNNPAEPRISAEAEQIRSEIVKPQEKNDQLLSQLLTTMDPLPAMDSVLAVFLKDTLVAWGEVGRQGIAIQYKNGVRGGIFLDADDMPDSTGLSRGEGIDAIDLEFSLPKARPSAVNTILLNPTYHERKYWADLIIQNYNDRLPTAGYKKPTIFRNAEVTVDKFQNLKGYGLIHVYSHGWAWPSKDNIREVYLLTGEAATLASLAKYKDEIHAGAVPVIRQHTASSSLWISPDFVARYNSFSADTTLIYGGFCYSYMGNWPRTMVNDLGAGGYFGFDWSVYTSENAKWNLNLIMNLCDTSQHPPVTASGWMNNEIPKWFWHDKYKKMVNIKYLGRQDLALIGSTFPVFRKCSIDLNILVDLQVKGGGINRGSSRTFSCEGAVTRVDEGAEENTCHVAWNEDRSGAHYAGGLELVINRTTLAVKSYKVWDKRTDTIGEATYAFEGSKSLALKAGAAYTAFVTANDACAALDKLDYSYAFSDGNGYTCISHSCDYRSSLYIKLMP